MSFEERIDRLTERHEALAQSVEMHNSMLTRLEALHQDQLLQNQHQREMMNALMEATSKLPRTAEQHESRIRDLEGRSL
jgi:hypothetical protein